MISDWTFWLEWFIKSAILIFGLLGGFAYLTWYERRALARIPNAVSGATGQARLVCFSQLPTR